MRLLKNRNFNNKPSGFTLIELIVVIGIIALLSVLASISLSNIREKGRDTKRLSDMDSLRTALELVKAKQSSYSKNLGCEANDLVAGCLNGALQETISNIKNFKDPVGVTPCLAASQDVCNYRLAELTPDNYVVYFFLEEGVGDFKARGLYAMSPEGVSLVNNEK